ncbi:hypothetical protein FKG94_08360 [Exilibacterium tricleocarpae]|uniref:TIGR02001 family outer membrane protein n=1 Tax=Exilibacterium tricleocarpae TaxID=2591008 RepID=A0A545TV77_9GAMM|nr:TorF family putative porin [Exilibacterium tricleocarpae]TQV81114.1 hypothetical protein FKG94_08360 [Exilibacterium tricleocarpae]
MPAKTFLVVGLSLAATTFSLASNAQQGATTNDFSFTANATLTSDYLFRGVSQTLEDPAVQAGFDFSHLSGLRGGVWSSNVDFQDRGPGDDQADQEIDVYLGYGTAINDDWSVDASFIRYIYPGTAGDSDLDYNELLATVNFRDLLSATLGYSNDVFNSDEDGIYYTISGNLPLPYNLRLTGSVGYYDLDDALDDSYTDWSIGVETDLGMFTARLAYVDTDSNGEDLFGDAAESRAVFSVTAVFGN